MNETILDLAERVAIAAYEKEVGTVNAAEANRLRNNLLARVDLQQEPPPNHGRPRRSPQGGRSNEGRSASPTTPRQSGQPHSSQREVQRHHSTRLPPSEPLIYFSQADLYFLDMQHQQATESLASAVTCSIAAIAARNDWFHDDDGIHEAVELLATGQNPEITGDIQQALAHSSELGHDLTSAFSAAMALPDLVKFGMGYDSANGSDEDARNFAKRAINLADRLNAERRATA